jgi:D-arabinose 1-dehydrogenase-like Zn-dependent alcohol dehydrogenase
MVGAGGVGLSSVMIAKALGASVIAVDRNARALEAAKALGADHALISSETGSGISDQDQASPAGMTMIDPHAGADQGRYS